MICGEASGDLHASNLVRELRTIDPRITIQGWGGDRLKAEQVEVLKHIRELSFMGFLEVFLNLFTILNNFKTCKAQIESFAPDVLILVDFVVHLLLLLDEILFIILLMIMVVGDHDEDDDDLLDS